VSGGLGKGVWGRGLGKGLCGWVGFTAEYWGFAMRFLEEQHRGWLEVVS